VRIVDFQWPLRVVTPTVDAYVLSILALTNDHAFTSGQLARMVPASEEGLRKVLKRLSLQGIIVAEHVGPAVGYRFNNEHLAAEPIRLLARLRTTLMTCLEEAMEAWEVAPVYAAVFGSVGRGDPQASSDIDLFMVRPPLEPGDEERAWADQQLALVLQVRRWTGNELEIVEFAQEELARQSSLLADVRDQGLTVYGSAAWFRRQVRGKGGG
jgi:predicted nucleotidyltransferase